MKRRNFALHLGEPHDLMKRRQFISLLGGGYGRRRLLEFSVIAALGEADNPYSRFI
jgi:hypothetical protein